jgi:hypothetical protein
VIKWATICTVTALAASLGWEIIHLDVNTDFLNGTITDEVYLVQLPGFEVKGQEHLVCKLNQALYGLKQAPQAWYECIDSYLRLSSWIISDADSNLYYLKEGNIIIILMIYVDDLYMTGDSPDKSQEICEEVMAHYKMFDLGPIQKYLSVEFL